MVVRTFHGWPAPHRLVAARGEVVARAAHERTLLFERLWRQAAAGDTSQAERGRAAALIQNAAAESGGADLNRKLNRKLNLELELEPYQQHWALALQLREVDLRRIKP
tara:strand:+ start:190 stop:513 length:324 start_codon:yes stop_codon:yes gene_type:complete